MPHKIFEMFPIALTQIGSKTEFLCHFDKAIVNTVDNNVVSHCIRSFQIHRRAVNRKFTVTFM